MKKHFRIKKTLVLLLLAANMISSVYSPVYATESMETYTESDFHAIEEKEEDVLQEDAASCNTGLLPEESQDTSIGDVEESILEDEEDSDFDKSQENLDGYQELIDESPFPVVNPISDNQMHIVSVEEEEIPSFYNSTENFQIVLPEYMPDLRNQTPYGSCWAFTSLALGEIYMRKHGIAQQDLSELHLAYFSYNYQPDPLGGTVNDDNRATYDSTFPNFLQRGGNLNLSQNILASWVGAANENLVPYNTAYSVLNEGIPADYAYQDVAHLTHYYNVNIKNDPQSVKALIMKNGAIGSSYYHDTSKYDWSHNSYYTKIAPEQINHAITIIGWNDEFPAENFKEAAEGNGAWLVRNSWSTGTNVESLNGYFWLSYYDKSLHSNGFSFAFDAAEKYDNNYQYDGASISGAFTLRTKSVTGANVFCAKANEAGETLEAVSFATGDANVDYKIDIYVNPTDETKPDSGTHIVDATTTGTTTYAGYYTIPLPHKVNLKNGDIFSVVVKLSSASDREIHLTMEISSDQGWINTIAATQPGQSYYLKAGSWIDNSSKENYGNFRIKAFTKNVQDPTFVSLSDFSFSEDTRRMHLLLGEEQFAGVNFEPADATRKNLVWESENSQIAEVTAEGKIIAHSAGTVNIIASYMRNGQIAIQKTFPVKVSQLQWTKEVEELQVGEELSLEYITNIDGKPSWATSEEQILSVDEIGKIVAKEAGEAVITLTIVDKSISQNIRIIESEKESQNQGQESELDKELSSQQPEQNKDWGEVLEEDRVAKEFATPEEIPQGFWTTSILNYTYTGKAITQPSLRVYKGKRLLQQGKDYSVKYNNNINAGEANIIITGKGNYTGSIIVPFFISKLDVSVSEDGVEDPIILSENPLYLTFNNQVQKGNVNVKYKLQGKETALKKGTDYTLEYPHANLTDAYGYDPNAFKTIGTYSIKLVGKGNYTGSREITECITAATLMKKLSYSISNESYDYSAENRGLKQEILPQKIVVRQGSQILHGFYAKDATTDEEAFQAYEGWMNTEENDGSECYHFIYYGLNHSSVGTAKLVFLGLEENGFVGKVDKTYKITGRTLSKASFGKELTQSYKWTDTMVDTYCWNEDEIGPVVPRTFETSEENKKEASVTYKIDSNNRVSLNGILKEEYKTIETEEEKAQYDYIYEYDGSLDKVGTVRIKFTGINGYSGTVTKTFKIIGTSIKNAVIKGLKNSYIYTGSKWEPAGNQETIPEDFSLTLPATKTTEEIPLIRNQHYTVSYEEGKNINAGTGTVYFTGINGYTGVLKKTFKITKYSFATDKENRITVESIGKQAYVKGGVKPQPKVYDGETLLKNTVDYTLSYLNNKAVNDGSIEGNLPTCIITGKGNYTGSIKVFFAIEETEISTCEMVVGDILYKTKENICKPTISIVDKNSRKKLDAGTDYGNSLDFSYPNGDPIDVKHGVIPLHTEIMVTVTGKNNYKGRISKTFRFVEKDINKAKVSIPSQAYTGEPITLEKDQLSIKYNNQTVSENQFEIVGYENNIKLGTAKVIIQGLGEFGGRKMISFKIVKKRMFLEQINVPNVKISLNQNEIRQLVGTTFQLKAFFAPETVENQIVEWKSDNTEIASVDEFGQVLLKKAGTTTIIAYSKQYNMQSSCVVVVEPIDNTVENTVLFGPENVTDEQDATADLNAAIKSLPSNATLRLKAGIYYIDAVKAIKLKSNMKFIMEEGAILKAIPNQYANYNIIRLSQIHNVTISGGLIVGERNQHTLSLGGKTDEWGMGIGIYDGKDITIKDVTIRDCNGDGIYLGTDNAFAPNPGCRNIYIENVKTDNNRRNNLSIVCAKDVILNGCAFINANGTAPEYGIDIETNYDVLPCERITIKNCYFEGNQEFALGIITAAKNIRIADSILDGGFVNYAGTEDIFLERTTIVGEAFAREGIQLGENVQFKGNADKEDRLIVEYIYGNHPLQIKYNGFTLQDITEGKYSNLSYGKTYRFEYKVLGKGQWNLKSSNTGRYFVNPKENELCTFAATLEADIHADSTRFYFFPEGESKAGDYIDIYEFKIYVLP